MPTLDFNSQFRKSFKSLPSDAQNRVGDALKKFIEDPKHPGLQMHRFHAGERRWTIRYGRGGRIVLKEITEDRFEVLDVGPHDKVYARMNRR